MDKERRKNLRQVVTQCRRILEEEIARRLNYYGVDLNGTAVDPVQLRHLTQDDLEVRRRLDDAIAKQVAGGLTREEAVKRYMRQVSFTYLNRLAALRAMEVRELIVETIVRRDKYGGMSLREWKLAEANLGMNRDEAFREALVEAFRERSREIKILFDPEDEYSLVFPRTKACLEVIRLLTDDITEDDWHQDDIIGWIYQYYNDLARDEYKEAKRKGLKRQPAPDDIPVINQFYTTPWIVKFLVDNALGRLWLEMHPESKLKDMCTYYSPLRTSPQPREAKSVREIKVLDPACGSGHFLVYAFDIFRQMYQEDETTTPVDDIPSLILENNLFGIDIDLRAVQLAALSLYLKAKTLNPKTQIRKVNLVCADVRLIDGKKQIEFLERFKDDRELQRIFARLFQDVKNAYEIGSLLKVKEPFDKLLAERKLQQTQTKLQVAPKAQAEQPQLVTPGQTYLTVLAGKEDGRHAITMPKQRTLQEMMQEIRRLEHEALEAHDMGRLLFAAEAAKSVGLLSLLSEGYDIVLMNPPYGRLLPTATKIYLRANYERTHFDYYAAFIEQAVNLCEPTGYVGMLTSSTFMFLKHFTRLREEILWNEAAPELIADLGSGVLDIPTVEWAASLLSRRVEIGQASEEDSCTFLRLKVHRSEQAKIDALEEVITALRKGGNHSLVYTATLGDLNKVPTTPYAYWVTTSIRRLYEAHQPLDRDCVADRYRPRIADVRQGLATSDDTRFMRYFWEVPPDKIGVTRAETFTGKKWIPCVRGSWLDAFYGEISLVVDWENDGEHIKNLKDSRGKTLSRPQSQRFYFHEGLTWMTTPQFGTMVKGTQKRVNVHRLPPGCIFTVNKSAVIPVKQELLWSMLGLLNSSLVYYLMRLQAPRHLDVGQMATVPVAIDADLSTLGLLARECHDLIREWITGDEASAMYVEPWILQVLHSFDASRKPRTEHPLAQEFTWMDWPALQQIRGIQASSDMSLEVLSQLCLERERILSARISELLRLIDDEVYNIYGVPQEDGKLIETELGIEPDQAEAVHAEEKIQDHIKRLISFYVKRVVESDEDGIVPLDESHDDCLLAQVLQQLALDFGKDRVASIEEEFEKVAGKSLKEWLQEDYFSYHVSLYKRRPTLWKLTSENFSSNKGEAFSCFLHYHRLTRNTIPKVRAWPYVKAVLERAQRDAERVRREIREAKARGDKKRLSRLDEDYEEATSRLEEIRKFDEALVRLHNPRQDRTELGQDAKWVERAIAEVRDNGWNPIIDHGVRVNIEPLKELKLLPKAAESVK